MAGSFRNDSIYDEVDEDYKDLDDISGAIQLDLFNSPSGEGSLKSWDVPEGTSRINKPSKSKDSIAVERLLCVDGWEKTTIDADGKKNSEGPMSLWILKFNFKSSYMDKIQLSYFRAELHLKDKNQRRRDHPKVEAWAPWRKRELGNISQAQETVNTTTEVGLQGGYQGSQASLKRSKTHEISFNRITFDMAESGLLWSRLDGKQIGVYWEVERNPINMRNKGVGLSAEIWAAALVARPSNEPYSVEFGCMVNKGTLQDFYDQNIKTTFRQPDAPNGEVSRFSVTPRPGQFRSWGSPEGKQIERTGNIDPENLGSLRNPQLATSLKVSWTEDFQRIPEIPRGAVAPEPVAAEKAASAAPTIGIHLGDKLGDFPGTGVNPVAVPEQPHALGSTSMPPVVGPQAPWSPAVGSSTGAIIADPSTNKSNPTPPPPMDSKHPGGDSSYSASSRLVALEARLAQTEARLAAQDLIILQLQQAMLAKEAKLAKMEQAAIAALSKLMG
ncbi:hypothetical protein F5884DRAFT_888202 [Xylogone sp. PMI_703]|nr:hypothetical protein F5884DRAFT_888202 [Xylogone sp. PMI_703]